MLKIFQNPIFRFGLIFMAVAGAGALFFPATFGKLFESVGMPHSHCYLDDPRMIWLHVVSDTFIGLAYVSISATLAYLVYRASRSIPFHWMFLAFGLFIISCGFTHFMEVWTVWRPVYWLAGWIKVITAVASVTTAVALFPLVPRVFSLIEAVKISEDRRVKLAAANRELESFASTISHDLRAPLRAIQGMAQALHEDHGARLSPEADFFTSKIIKASVRMDELIQDLLDYSRMNLADFESVPVDLKPVLEEAVAMMAGVIRERGGAVSFEGEFPPVMGSHALINQVICNLLTNAVKFVPPGVKPQIKITGETRDLNARVSVADNGIGIAPEYHARIFRMFERLHTTSEYPGTGIGLAIVRRAVVRMGGKLGLESAIGKGSVFWIELPRRPAPRNDSP